MLMLPLEIIAPGRDIVTMEGAYREYVQPRLNTASVFRHRIYRERNVWQQVGFGDEHCLTGAKHLRVLARFVISLGRADEHHAQMFCQIMRGGTDEIPDILDE